MTHVSLVGSVSSALTGSAGAGVSSALGASGAGSAAGVSTSSFFFSFLGLLGALTFLSLKGARIFARRLGLLGLGVSSTLVSSLVSSAAGAACTIDETRYQDITVMELTGAASSLGASVVSATGAASATGAGSYEDIKKG